MSPNRFEMIAEQPDVFPIVYRDARLGLLRKFPYLVIYRTFPDFISVVAVIRGTAASAPVKVRGTD